ncbi:MAG: PA2169 family four-helix-bundle protein [Acidobacteriota bacterium]|nr:PA2169 family four-helix-bundle protein [Acidobacteriota bacterium]
MEPMTALREETVEKLQDLIEVNNDSCEGFKTASDQVNEDALANLFAQLAQDRAGFSAELQNYVRLNDETPDDDASARGTAHRLWLKVRAAINGGDAKVILIELERMEDKIKHTYEEVLEETGGALHDALQRQYTQVKAGHDRVRDLRDSYLDR